MRIATLDSRGVPASYGGIETCVEELGARLVERGHEVTTDIREMKRVSDRTGSVAAALQYTPILR